VHAKPDGGARRKADAASLADAAERGLAEQDRLIAISAEKAAGYRRQLQRALAAEQALLTRKRNDPGT
jgi:hypothetical protein